MTEEEIQKKYAMLQRKPMAHRHYLAIDLDRNRPARRIGPAVQITADLEQMWEGSNSLTLGERLRVGKHLMELAQELLAQHPKCWRTSQCERPAEFQIVRWKIENGVQRGDKPDHLYSCNYCLGHLLRDLTINKKMKTFDVNPIMEAR